MANAFLIQALSGMAASLQGILHGLGSRTHLLFLDHLSSLIEHAVKARPITQIETNRQPQTLHFPCPTPRRSGKLFHCRSPDLSRLQRVDDLGALCIPPETGLLISS
jgi:hypothetical protein